MRHITISKTTARQFLTVVAVYAIGCGAAAVLFPWGSAWMLILFAAGATVAVIAWRQAPWPDEWSRYVSFGAVLLFVCVINRFFYIADYFISPLQYDQWPFFASSPKAALFKGEAIMIVGTLLTVLGWRLGGGLKVSPAAALAQPQRSSRIILTVYIASLAGMLLATQVPRIATALGQLVPTLLTLGLVSTFLLPVARLRMPHARLAAVVVLSVPFVVLAAKSGMKETLILAVLPGALMAWRTFRHPLARATMIAVGLAGLAVITAYVNLYRNEVWIPESHGLAATTQSVPDDFKNQIRTDGLFPTIANGLSAFTSRVDQSYAHGWPVSIVIGD